MTLKDIADKAGVSMMTVSNVINGKTSRVSRKTMDKVNAIIKECGYVPNLTARSLTNKKSNIIGVVVAIEEEVNVTDDNYMENPYVSAMIGIIEHELKKNDYYTMIRSVSKEGDINTLLKNWNVDGIIFLYPENGKYMNAFLETAPCPIAVFDSDLELPDVINISSDDEKGVYLSTKYLINHGHSHIAFVADYENSTVLTRRFQGYRKALEESKIPFRPEYVYPYSPSYEEGIKAGKEIASDYTPITAVVTTADICAIGVMEGARLGGYRVPIDLSVVGYDNLALCQYTVPKLTSVSQNVKQKATLAVKLLLERIDTGTPVTGNRIMTDVEVVDRQSVVSLF